MIFLKHFFYSCVDFFLFLLFFLLFCVFLNECSPEKKVFPLSRVLQRQSAFFPLHWKKSFTVWDFFPPSHPLFASRQEFLFKSDMKHLAWCKTDDVLQTSPALPQEGLSTAEPIFRLVPWKAACMQPSHHSTPAQSVLLWPPPPITPCSTTSTTSSGLRHRRPFYLPASTERRIRATSSWDRRRGWMLQLWIHPKQKQRGIILPLHRGEWANRLEPCPHPLKLVLGLYFTLPPEK